MWSISDIVLCGYIVSYRGYCYIGNGAMLDPPKNNCQFAIYTNICYPDTMFAKILLVWLAFAVMLWVMLAGVLLEKHIKIFKESLEKEEIVAMSVY